MKEWEERFEDDGLLGLGERGFLPLGHVATGNVFSPLITQSLPLSPLDIASLAAHLGPSFIAFPAHHLLHYGFQNQFHFLLQPSHKVTAFTSLIQDQSPSLSSSTVLRLEEDSFRVLANVETHTEKARVVFNFGDPLESTSSFGIEVESRLQASFPQQSHFHLNLACNFPEQFHGRIRVDPLQRDISGWVLIGNKENRISLEAQWRHEDRGKLAKLEIGMSTKNQDGPPSYEIALVCKDLGSKIIGSYYQHLYWGSRNVALAGEFIHDGSSPQNLLNILRIGGLWQVSKHTAIKGRIDSTGQVDGMAFAKFSLANLNCTVGISLGTRFPGSPPEPRLGFFLSLSNVLTSLPSSF